MPSPTSPRTTTVRASARITSRSVKPRRRGAGEKGRRGEEKRRWSGCPAFLPFSIALIPTFDMLGSSRCRGTGRRGRRGVGVVGVRQPCTSENFSGCWAAGKSRVTVTRTLSSPVSSVASGLIEKSQRGTDGSSDSLAVSKGVLSTASGVVIPAWISASLLSASICTRPPRRRRVPHRQAGDFAQYGQRSRKDGQGQDHFQEREAVAAGRGGGE